MSLIVLGVASIVAIFLTSKKSPYTRTVAVVIFFIALISFGLVARTGYIGGQIRHTEINSNSGMPTQVSDDKEQD